MSHSRNDNRSEENKTVEESNTLSAKNALLESALKKAVIRQGELERKIKADTLSICKERKSNVEEKTKFIAQIKNLEFENRQLTTTGEQLELDLIKANEKIKQLTEAFQQVESDLIKANEKIKSLTEAPQQTASSTLENKASSTEADCAAPSVTEPVTGKETTTQTPAAVGSSSLGIFNPWRILGYTDAKSTPSQENPAHISLADLTKASVEQALAENNATPGMRK